MLFPQRRGLLKQTDCTAFVALEKRKTLRKFWGSILPPAAPALVVVAKGLTNCLPAGCQLFSLEEQWKQQAGSKSTQNKVSSKDSIFLPPRSTYSIDISQPVAYGFPIFDGKRRLILKCDGASGGGRKERLPDGSALHLLRFVG